MEALIIRPAHLGDAANLVVLKQQVWVSTYAVQGIRDEFSSYLLAHFTLENEKAILENPEKRILVAESNGHLVGCVEIAFDAMCTIESIGKNPEITILYVLESFEYKGIGRSLLDTALRQIKHRNLQFAWLTVYHENIHAIKFYRKFGFIELGSMDFILGDNKYLNKVMVFDLNGSF